MTSGGHECTESFQDGYVQAFAFFGGVPIRISYDNCRIAVKKFVGARGSGGRKRELAEGFLRLQSHYLFTEHFCLVRQANEKGRRREPGGLHATQLPGAAAVGAIVR